MVDMAATASSVMNSSRRIGVDVHGMMKKNYVSSWGLQIKAPTKVNVTKVGGINWSMLFPTVKTIPMKPMMMLGKEKKYPKLVPDLGLGSVVNDDRIFGQKFCIRSYEVGPDGTASETNTNHLKAFGFLADDFGSVDMSEKNLTWVTIKMQMILDRYPTWGDIVQINTWKSAYGNNGVSSNFTFCDCKTEEILGRASSISVMMNKKTRKLSKFPNEIRAKQQKYYVDTPAIMEQDITTWSKGNEIIKDHICKGLMPRWSDLDINQHVNHAKYIRWILESVPRTISENYEIESMTLEYYRECTADTVLQSVTSILANHKGKIVMDDIHCQHLLEFEIGGEILKGRTRWRPKRKNGDAGVLIK
uniref:Acyl-[acyl-carrier-protein] hydrolase n=2 Tax=Lactuca sativa TaxID=4236 RepID=A0A9R1VE75_LACSA|nr:hypothetical protein LSAT_V11C500264600 [Lactuca sativa]